MSQHRNELAEGEGVLNCAGGEEGAELGEDHHKLCDEDRRHLRRNLLQQLLLAAGVGVLHDEAREEVAALTIEVVAVEGEAGRVGEHNHSEVGVDGDHVGVSRAVSGSRGPTRDTAAVAEAHLAVLNEPL